jgi:hypothetical protein
MATITKPKKQFANGAERQYFVQQYQKKFKTELCKNWEMFGKCKFENNCSFAHGNHELNKKNHVPSMFKSRICTSYHFNRHCKYGSRC